MKTYSIRFEIEASSPDEALDQVCEMLNSGSSCDEIYEIEYTDGADDPRLRDVSSELEVSNG